MKEPKVIHIPIYNESLTVYPEHMPECMPEQLRREDATATYWADDKGIYLAVDLESFRLDSLAHECVHLANRILESRNVVYYPTQDEALAYLVGFLFSAIYCECFGGSTKNPTASEKEEV